MPLNITHTWPKLGMDIQNAKLNLSNNFVVDFKVSHTDPQLQINSSSSKLHIDQTKAFGDEGLKTIQDLMDQFVQDGKQAALSYIEKKVAESERLSEIEKGGSPIADIARDNTFPQKNFNIGMMPEHPPEIQVEPGKLKFNLIKGEVNIEYNHVPIEANYIPPKIKYYMIQNGDLNIEFTGNNVDTKV